MRVTLRVLGALIIASLLTFQLGARAQVKVKVLSDAPLRPALEQLADAFRRETGNQLEFVFGTSPVVHKKVADGETADVLIIQPNFIDELVKAGKVVPREHPVIGRVGFGLAVRADAPARDIATTEAFKGRLGDFQQRRLGQLLRESAGTPGHRRGGEAQSCSH